MRIVKPIAVVDANLISSSVPENDQQIYSSLAGYSLKDKVLVLSTHAIYEVRNQETSAVTISQGTPALITWNNHGLTNGRMVKFSTSGSLPTGLNNTTTYFVVNSSTNTFNVSATSGGSAISTSTAGSGTQTALALVNNMDPVTNPTYWLYSGASNRWKMFDKSVQSQTTGTTSITASLSFSQRVDTIPLINLTGSSVNVKVTNPTYGTVVDKTVQLLTDEMPVIDLESYLYAGFVQRTEVVFEDIPPYSNNQIAITVTASEGAQVGIGAAVFGQARDISSTGLGVEQGARFGIDDYSIKTRDAFGNFVITERAFADRANVTIFVNNSELSSIKNFLTGLRATPVVFIGSKKHDYLTIYGFYKSWEVDVSYPDFSVLSMEVSGLT